jgi:hypothetical protein
LRLRQKILALACAIILGATMGALQARSQSQTLEVFPQPASKLPAIELSEFIAMLIPSSGFEHLDWDYFSDGPVRWITDGFASDDAVDETTRDALVRVRVRGKASTVLKQRREELAWTLSLVTKGNPKFGPTFIRLEPGQLVGDGQCFGTLYGGCTFKPEDAIGSPHVRAELLCEYEFNGHPGVYRLEENGRPPVLLAYFLGGGSGGESSELEIHPVEDATELCQTSQ